MFQDIFHQLPGCFKLGGFTFQVLRQDPGGKVLPSRSKVLVRLLRCVVGLPCGSTELNICFGKIQKNGNMYNMYIYIYLEFFSFFGNFKKKSNVGRVILPPCLRCRSRFVALRGRERHKKAVCLVYCNQGEGFKQHQSAEHLKWEVSIFNIFKDSKCRTWWAKFWTICHWKIQEQTVTCFKLYQLARFSSNNIHRIWCTKQKKTRLASIFCEPSRAGCNLILRKPRWSF